MCGHVCNEMHSNTLSRPNSSSPFFCLPVFAFVGTNLLSRIRTHSQMKQSATIAATAASTTANVTVPAAGIWGSWFGYTTTASVSWLSLHPLAIPGLACYAAITIGVPTIMYLKARTQWKATSERLTNAFWDSANEHPEVFAECLTHWSEKG